MKVKRSDIAIDDRVHTLALSSSFPVSPFVIKGLECVWCFIMLRDHSAAGGHTAVIQASFRLIRARLTPNQKKQGFV